MFRNMVLTMLRKRQGSVAACSIARDSGSVCAVVKRERACEPAEPLSLSARLVLALPRLFERHQRVAAEAEGASPSLYANKRHAETGAVEGRRVPNSRRPFETVYTRASISSMQRVAALAIATSLSTK